MKRVPIQFEDLQAQITDESLIGNEIGRLSCSSQLDDEHSLIDGTRSEQLWPTK